MGLKIICVIGIAWNFIYIIGGVGALCALSMVKAGQIPAPPMLDENLEVAYIRFFAFIVIIPATVFSFLFILLYQMNRKGWIVFMVLQVIMIILDTYSIAKGLVYTNATLSGLVFVAGHLTANGISVAYLWNKRGIFN